MQKALLFAQLVVLAILATVHVTALSNDLYWILPWLDLTTHFLGGAWVALFFFWMHALLRRVPNLPYSLSFVLVLGIAWEVFELSLGISAATDYAFDTLSDLFMDALGGLLVVGAIRSFSRRDVRSR